MSLCPFITCNSSKSEAILKIRCLDVAKNDESRSSGSEDIEVKMGYLIST